MLGILISVQVIVKLNKWEIKLVNPLIAEGIYYYIYMDFLISAEL